MKDTKIENTIPIKWRILSGLLLSQFVGSLFLIAMCPAMLRWAYATCQYDNFGELYSGPVIFGYAVPDIAPIALALVGILSLCLFAMQLRPVFRALANIKTCLSLAIPTGIAIWIAYNTLTKFIGELMWMHL